MLATIFLSQVDGTERVGWLNREQKSGHNQSLQFVESEFVPTTAAAAITKKALNSKQQHNATRSPVSCLLASKASYLSPARPPARYCFFSERAAQIVFGPARSLLISSSFISSDLIQGKAMQF